MAIKRTRESEEMYLETTLLLHKGQPNVRAADVRDELGLAKSSVSRGVNLLEKKGYILDKNIIFNSSVRPQSTKIKDQYEYRPLTMAELKDRSGCAKSHTIYGNKVKNSCHLVRVDSFRNSNAFVEVLGYINTMPQNQRKGRRGSVE